MNASSSPLRFLIAGAANPHVPGYLRMFAAGNGSEILCAFADASDERRANAKKILAPCADVRYFRDWRTMLDKCEADAVIIGTDNIEHIQVFRAAAKRKLDIYMMKVISMNEDECREMIELRDAAKCTVQCELELHFGECFREARRQVRSGALGAIRSIHLSNVSQSPCNYFPNWGDPLLSYGSTVPLRPGAKVFRGGAITDHPHPFDLARWITGQEFVSVRAVSARNQRAALRVEDHAVITGELSEGTAFFIDPSYGNLEAPVDRRELFWPKSLECSIKITGEKGYYACDYFDRTALVVAHESPSPDRLIVEGLPRGPELPDDMLFSSFTAALAGRRAVEVSLEEDFAAVRAMNAAYESIFRDGEPVEL